MDILGSLLGSTDGPHCLGSPFLMSMRNPWLLQIADRAHLSVLAVTHGRARIDYVDGTWIELATGDVALIRGTHDYTCGDHPDSPVIAYVDESGDCRSTTDQSSLEAPLTVGVRTWGNSEVGTADNRLLMGIYRDSEVTRRIVESLDRITVVPMADVSIVSILAAEVVRNDLGQDAVLQRLLDVVLMNALRRWLRSADTHKPTWYQAHTDPVVGQALRLLHHNPAHPWTVPALARECGVSRPVLARRFTDLVGQSPMAYLSQWRLSIAADLLTDGDLPVNTIAARVGYASAFAFSSAFKRAYGRSPREHRLRDRDAALV